MAKTLLEDENEALLQRIAGLELHNRALMRRLEQAHVGQGAPQVQAQAQAAGDPTLVAQGASEWVAKREEGPDDGVFHIAAAPDGTFFTAVLRGSASVELRRAGDGGVSLERRWRLGGVDNCNRTAVTAAGMLLVSCQCDRSGQPVIKEFNCSSGQRTGKVLQGHGAIISALAAASSHDRAISGDDDGGAIVWDLGSGRLLHQLRDGHLQESLISAVAISGSGSLALVAQAGNREATVYELPASGRARPRFTLKHRQGGGDAPPGPVGAMMAAMARRTAEWAAMAAFSSDGSVLVTGTDEGRLYLWDLGAAGRHQRELLPAAKLTTSDAAPVSGLAFFSPAGCAEAGPRLAYSTAGGCVGAVDVASRRHVGGAHRPFEFKSAGEQAIVGLAMLHAAGQLVVASRHCSQLVVYSV